MHDLSKKDPIIVNRGKINMLTILIGLRKVKQHTHKLGGLMSNLNNVSQTKDFLQHQI